jgi:hypothetical protein
MEKIDDNHLSDLEENISASSLNNYHMINNQEERKIVYDIISKCHNSVVGHHGVSRTKRMIESSGLSDEIKRHFSGNIFKLVHEYINLCPICQKTKPDQDDLDVDVRVTNTFEPFECIAIDTIGPLPRDNDDNCYIIAIIDCFSRAVELVPAKDCTAKSAAKAILMILKYGFPSTIQTDNGPQFAAEMVEELLKFFSIYHRYTLPYRPQANGIVERSNREIMKHLRCIVLDKRVKETWSTYLPFVQRIMMYSFHRSIGTYPARILYGDSISPNRGLITEWSDKKTIKEITYSEYVTQLNEQLRNIVHASQVYQREVNKKKLEKTPENPSKFSVGDYVLISYPAQPPNKLVSPWRGPYIISEIKNQTYCCRDLINNKIIEVFIDRLKGYRAENDIDPKDLSMSDREEFYVESILDHRGDLKKKKSLEFKIRWLGYSPEDDTWEPYSAVRECKALDEYLALNNLKL